MNKIIYIFIFAIILLSLIFFNFKGKMELKSVFDKGSIPSKYTCDGKNINPPLEISGTPEKAKSLVLIIEDPDAPAKTWVHWLVWNIPVNTKIIKENSVPKNAVQGVNDFGKNNYGGPCPPSGTHRYLFKIYALDIFLKLPENSTKQDVKDAMKKHIIDKAILQGSYSKQ